MTMMFVNLPVADLARSEAFYVALGGAPNPAFSDAESRCVMLSDGIGVMLLTHARYGQFTSRPIGDARRESQMLIALSAESRDAVGDTVAAAARAGGTADPTPAQDHGFMLNRTVEDPNGYVWEIMWMDMNAAAQNS